MTPSRDRISAMSRIPDPRGILTMWSAASGPCASKRCLPKNSAIPAANAARTKALMTALPITTSGCRALAERRAGRSTLSGSIAALGLRGMRLGSLLLGPVAAVLSALAVRHPFPELSGIEDGDDDRPALARAAGLFGGLAPVTAAHPVLRPA